MADVGLFQAANSLTNQYIGIVFSALALDYFPRISAVSEDAGQLRDVVNRQAEIVILIATPLLLALIAMASLVIRILLSADFLPTIPLVRWLALGTLLQAVTFPLGYIFLAKNNKKVYMWGEVITGNILWIICSVAGYLLFGLVGLGISVVARSLLDIGISYTLCRHFYSFFYYRNVALTIAGCLLVATAGFLCSFNESVWGFAGLWTCVVATTIFALWRLRRLLQSEKESR